MRLRATLLLAVVLAGLCPRAARAVDPSVPLSDYLLTTWGRRDGLLSTFIRGIVQTTDGYLWLATTDGVFRFDGVRFVQWRAKTGDVRLLGIVNALHAARDGGLWVGTESGIVGRIHGDTLEALDVDEPVLGIAEARNGDAWLATRDRVLQVRSARPQHIARETRLSARFLSGPVQTADGAIWVSTETATLRVDTDAESPAVMRAGRFWLTSGTRGEIVPTDVSHVAVRTAYRDSFGTTWIGTVGSGLLRSLRSSASAPETFAHADGLANDAVWAVFEDREHNLWIGTENGLQSFRDVRFRTLRWPQDADGLVAGRDNAVWTATQDGLARVGAQATTVHPSRDRIMALTGDHRGRVWVYTPARIVSLADGGDDTIQLDRGSTPHDVVAMAVDNTDTVWLCDRTRGVLRWRNRNLDDLSNEPALKGREIQVAYADTRGRVWFGARDGSVVVTESGRFRVFDRPDGLPGSVVNSLLTDRHGITWVATETGLARFDGSRFTTWTTENGLPGRRVIWVLGDDNDGLWLGFSFGVLHIVAAELAAATRDPAHQLSSTLYDTDDGIAGSLEYGMQSRAVRASDGTLWFRTTEGVSSINPTRLTFNALPPPVVIEGMLADGRPLDVTAPILLPPLTRSIEFDYAGLSLVAPRRVRFRYRLEGYDADWQDAGTRRQAIYTNLPPRAYRFHVLASNNDGVWSESGASQSFILRPAFYQTIWFRFAVAFALVTGGWSAYRLRVRYVTSQLRLRYDERLAERTRIARELHDHLLQSMLGVSLQVELMDELLPPDAPARRPLERALELSKTALADGRRALNDLRSQTVDRDGIVAALSEVAKNLASPDGPDVQVSTDGDERPLHGIAGHDVVLIIREAVANALRHAKAKRVRVILAYRSDRFRLVVTDDGVGINERTLHDGEHGHYGIEGMRERAERIGGTLTIVSGAGDGTELVLTVPGHVAYADDRTERA